MLNKRDWIGIIVIGIAVGILVQPILSNIIGNPAYKTIPIRIGLLVAFSVLAPLALFVCAMLAKVLAIFYQFGKFAAVGVLNTVIDLGVLNLEIFLNGAAATGLLYAAFKGVSFLVATTNSFYWNKYWTFNEKQPADTRERVMFYVVSVIGLLINVGIATSVVYFFSGDTESSQKLWANAGAIIATIGTLVWNFVGYKFFVFKQSSVPAALTDGQ